MAAKDNIMMLRRFRSEFEAQVAKSMLETAGIPAMIMRDDAGGMEPQFQFIRGVRLMVREQDREEAEALLQTELGGEEESTRED